MYDTIIIGAGISGLYSALNINKTKKVALFEKSQYFGGRIYTDNIKIDSKEYLLEAGAGRILSTHNKMLNLIEQFNLKNNLIKINSEIDFVPSKNYTLKNSFHDKTGYHFIDRLIKKSESISDKSLKKITFKEYAIKHLSKDQVKFMLDSSDITAILLFRTLMMLYKFLSILYVLIKNIML